MVVIGPKWQINSLLLQGYAEQLAQDIRFTQAKTMAGTKNYSIRWIDTHSYAIFDANNTQVPPSPLTLDHVTLSPFSITFDTDEMGSPGLADTTIRLSMNGDNLDVVVVGLTGAVTLP